MRPKTGLLPFSELNEETGVVEGQEQEGELDAFVLDNIHVAGARFDRLVKSLLSGQSE